MGNQGWIKLHRKILRSDMYKSLNSKQRDVMITVLLMANHEENEWEHGGELYRVKPGQFVTSLNSIKNNCANDVSIQNIRTALDKMKTWGFLTWKSTNKNRLITIENWAIYQSNDSETNKQTNNQLTNNSQTTNNQLTTNKNDIRMNKNDKEINTSRRKQREYEESSPYMKMAKYFLQKIREWKPDYVFRGNMHTWADHFRKIHELDKRSKESIKEVIDWATSDDFWQVNILSPAKLRKQFDTLQARMNQERNREQGSKVVPMRQYQQEPARPNVIPNNTEDILAKYEAALRESQKRVQKG